MPYSLAEFGSILEDTLVVKIKVMITGEEKITRVRLKLW